MAHLGFEQSQDGSMFDFRFCTFGIIGDRKVLPDLRNYRAKSFTSNKLFFLASGATTRTDQPGKITTDSLKRALVVQMLR